MTTLHDIHIEAEKEIDKKRLTIHLHSAEFIALSEFLRTLDRPDGISGTYANIGSGGLWSLNGLYVQVHLDEHETFASAAPIIGWFLNNGWEQNGQSEDASWGASIGYREVKFKKQAPPPLFWKHRDLPKQDLYGTVRIWPNPKSQNCKRVQIGVEPTYKIVCGE